ncbi:hypothetical protein SI859A1_00796 [Aurantimonas manganoxydans SI85-9A1]|uniref:Secreted protein n=1 Tax=Aurantimonas manganoxydans (strain ATCC BAA-1229 / DSM 21871 / SI85-9A1) TaxID=287752 RepID=Q1YK50_AURMS|nr:hypothetical protein [Aurantimonas manganoxydans]EAS50673.1 hypothetical protein SI859A1_00796 [Aurantimonas manganoxydans SI85-9A1]
MSKTAYIYSIALALYATPAFSQDPQEIYEIGLAAQLAKQCDTLKLSDKSKYDAEIHSKSPYFAKGVSKVAILFAQSTQEYDQAIICSQFSGKLGDRLVDVIAPVPSKPDNPGKPFAYICAVDELELKIGDEISKKDMSNIGVSSLITEVEIIHCAQECITANFSHQDDNLRRIYIAEDGQKFITSIIAIAIAGLYQRERQMDDYLAEYDYTATCIDAEDSSTAQELAESIRKRAAK